jgi:antitoxin YefM
MAKVALDLEADIQPVSDFRANASEMLEQVQRTGRPLVLTKRGRGAAVLLDIAVFQRLLDEIDELRDVRRGMADVEAGDVVDHADVASSLLGRLSGRR